MWGGGVEVVGGWQHRSNRLGLRGFCYSFYTPQPRARTNAWGYP